MARSILPSRWRGAAVVRASVHRAVRRQVSQSLRQMTGDPGAWDEGVDFGESAELELGHVVSRRRGADKLNHFERWAIERTRELPKEERLGHLRALLPSGLIGQHAMSHLKNRDELAVRGFRPSWSSRKLLMDRGELAVLLREVVASGGGVRSLHRAMVKAVRVDYAGQPVRGGGRKLLGLHDVLPFIAWLERNRNSRFVVDSFCRAFKESGDVELACTRAIARAVIPLNDVEWVRR